MIIQKTEYIAFLSHNHPDIKEENLVLIIKTHKFE